jgi:hypothetical protein
MEMRIASVNLNSVDFDKLEGAEVFYPIPMPVLAKKSNEDTFLIYSLTDKSQWSKNASMDVDVDMSAKSGIPLQIPLGIFKKHFMALGGDFDGTGIYGKIPNPVISLKVDVPCTYSSAMKKNSVPPNSVVIKLSNGAFRHYDSKDFERMFVSNLSVLSDMKLVMKNHSNENQIQNKSNESELKM